MTLLRLSHTTSLSQICWWWHCAMAKGLPLGSSRLTWCWTRSPSRLSWANQESHQCLGACWLRQPPLRKFKLHWWTPVLCWWHLNARRTRLHYHLSGTHLHKWDRPLSQVLRHQGRMVRSSHLGSSWQNTLQCFYANVGRPSRRSRHIRPLYTDKGRPFR